jgi:hypothetical protein
MRLARHSIPCSLSFACEPIVLIYELELSMKTMLTRSVFYATLMSKRLRDTLSLRLHHSAHERQAFWSHLEDALGVMDRV